MLPDWAPNIHPLIIHFPIVLIPLAFVIHLLSVFLKKLDGWAFPVGLLYLGSTVSALAAFISGRQAADSVVLLPQANPVLSDHADLALWTLSISALATVLYWVWFRIKIKTELHLFALAINLISSGVMVITADHGGQLVYRFGTGVLSNQSMPVEKNTEIDPVGILKNLDGSWTWTPGFNDEKNDFPDFDFHHGSSELLTLEASRMGQYAVKDSVLFTLGEIVGDVQVEAILDLTQFDGSVAILHHYNNLNQYDYLEIKNTKMNLGRIAENETIIADSKEVEKNGWFTLKSIGSGRHFRGYMNEKLITHGHYSPFEPGYVGLRIYGKGIIGIKSIKVIPLKGEKA